MRQVVVLIACHNGRPFLDDCLASVLRNQEPDLVQHVLVVDDASTDGSADHVRSGFPTVRCLELTANVGFAGANNAGWRYIQQHLPDTTHLVLLNMDTVVTPGWLRPMIDALAADPNLAAVQAKLLLHDTPDRVNTAGDRSHFLGFGFMIGYNQPDDGRYDQPTPIDYPSGAALMVRTDLLERFGLFDDAFRMYLEDAELGWKLRQAGYDIRLAPASIVRHKYRFHAPRSWYEDLERNRWLLLLTYYKLPTLLLLSPALLLMEFGQWLYALGIGKPGAKLRSYAWFWRWANLEALWRKRREAQRRRTVGDRPFMTGFAGRLDVPGLQNPLLRWVGNPLLASYWRIVRPLIRW